MEIAAIRELLAERLWVVLEAEQNRGWGDNGIIRYIEGVNREDLDALVLYLQEYTSADNNTPSDTVTNPMAGTQWARTGVWNGGRIWYEEVKNTQELRGRLRIYQYLYSGDKTDGDIITEDGCRWKATTTWYFGVKDIPALPQGSSGIVYRMGQLTLDKDDGTYTTYIEKRERLYQKIPEYQSRRSDAGRQDTQRHFGVRDGDKDENGNAIALIDLNSVPVGEIWDLDRNKNEDCTQDIVEQKRKVFNQTRGSTEDSAARNVIRELHTENATELGQASSTPGKIIRHSNEPTESGLTRTVKETVSVKDQVGGGGEESAARSVVRETHTENEAELEVEGEPEPGTIVRYTNDPTESGLTRTVKETIQVKDQTSVGGEDSAARNVSRELHTENAAALVTPVTSEPGKIIRHSNEPTESGRTRTIKETIQVKDQTGDGAEETGAVASSRVTHTQAETKPELPTFEAGKIVRVEAMPTEAGRWQTREEELVAKNQQGKSYRKSAAADTNITLDTQAEDEVTPTTPAQGKIITVRNTPTEFDLVRVEVEEITVKNQMTEYGEDRDDHNTHVEYNTEKAVAPAEPTMEEGVVRRTEVMPTESGKYRTTETEITAKKQQWAQSWLDRYGTSYLWAGRNVTAAELAAVLTAAVLTTATNNDLRLDKNQFGLFDYTLTKTPFGGGAETRESFDGELGTQSRDLYDIERRACSEDQDPQGYQWRQIMITVTEYVGNSWDTAWSNIADGDSDSMTPKLVGRKGGYAIYRSIQKKRTYSAAWQPSASDSK